MIPKNITRDTLLQAMQLIDAEGVPKSRWSRRYNVVYEGKRYPPKYLLSIANRIANHCELMPYEFGGGAETNGFFMKNGFVIEPLHTNLSDRLPQKSVQAKASASSQGKIITVTVENHGTDYWSNKEGFGLMEKAIRTYMDADILLFPAGFFYLDKQDNRNVTGVAHAVSRLLQGGKGKTTVVFGIDCDGSNDQLALAVNAKGVLAIGRKFYPTCGEKGSIRLAETFSAQEMDCSRIFENNGKKFFLGVCYDCFGIQKLNLENPGVDAVLVLAHQFWRKGMGSSGDVDFARKGFAGASQRWGCPVFGTATFFARAMPDRWPTAVLWENSRASVKTFKYQDNKMQPEERLAIQGNKQTLVCCVYRF